MKKRIMLIGIGIGLIFILIILLGSIMDDSHLATQISMGIGIAYFILLTIFAYAKNLYRYFKTGQFPDQSGLATWVVELLTITSNKNIESSSVMIEGAYHSSKEYKKVNDKLGIFTYTLFYIALWSFLGFIFYEFVFQPDELNSISETLLWISFISFVLAIYIIIMFVLFAMVKSTKSIMKNREKEYQQLKETNKLAYDLKIFKRHYAKPYYVLAYIGISGVILSVVGVIYNYIFDAYMADLFGIFKPLLVIFVFISIFLALLYLPLLFPVIIHTMKMNSKRQIITLTPLKIRMITKDGTSQYGIYEKVEKNYLVNEIESYSITNRWFIINGQIESVIRKTVDSSTKEKTKTLNKLKIPRIFSNENILIEYLEKSLKERKI